MMRDAGLAVLRGVTGGLMVGHGAQKLFGAFEGPGRAGTAGFMESLGLKPGHIWGTAAALSEFGGGALTALGFLNPLGPIGVMSSMIMAALTAHEGKPIWVTAGGAELPVTNMGVCVALMLTGPGDYALDNALGIELPKPVTAAALLGAGAMIGYGLMSRAAAQQAQEESQAEQASPQAQPEQAAPQAQAEQEPSQAESGKGGVAQPAPEPSPVS